MKYSKKIVRNALLEHFKFYKGAEAEGNAKMCAFQVEIEHVSDSQYNSRHVDCVERDEREA